MRKIMKRIVLLPLTVIVSAALVFSGCSLRTAGTSVASGTSGTASTAGTAQTSAGLVGKVSDPQKVVALSTSLADIWQLAGGNLYGVSTEVMMSKKELGLSDDIKTVGSLKDPDAEKILAMDPDLVILTPNLENHRKLAELLEDRGIAVYKADVASPKEYLQVLGDFCDITGRKDLYKKNGTDVIARISKLLNKVPKEDTMPTALVLRAYSSGVDVKVRDNVACDILTNAGIKNVAEGNRSLEKLSAESVIAADPDYIFITVMGPNESGAMKSIYSAMGSNAAWKKLSAVKAGHVYVLPHDLFQLKPNDRWDEAYRYILNLVWPEVYSNE